ncbi:MAG: hypothetical protein VW362_12850, partial [Candidatus Nanopelagicales bacterium]
MCDFLDSGADAMHLEAPRGSYKTTIAMSWVIRQILKDPNLRVLYVMETEPLALEKLATIKQHFEGATITEEGATATCSRLVDVFGDQTTEKWAEDRFTIRGRTRVVDAPTFRALGVESKFTGVHADIFVLDDLVSFQSIRTSDGIEKTKSVFKMIQPLADEGAIILVIGTRYHDEDLYGWILSELEGDFQTLILDCGMQLEKNTQSHYFLAGTPRFEHQNEDFLKTKLRRMGPTDFSSQYINKCLSGAMQIFHREWFRTMEWKDWMSHLSGYILTDTATSEQDDGCHSVIALVGLDNKGNAYLLDMRVGHWHPNTFVSEFFDVLEKWDERIKIKAQLMEKISLTRVFKSMLAEEAVNRQVRLNVVDIPRGIDDKSKDQRIQGLSGRMNDGRFIVVDTVPTRFHDLGKEVLLWD